MVTAASRLKIGLSACFSHADPQRSLFTGKTLQYVEQTIAHWLMSSGAMVVMVPCPTGATMRGDVTFDHYAEWLDGLVMHGGADVWPGSYGEEPLHETWGGARVRDEYDKALVYAFERVGKPIFGVCRGLQLINVAFGGTLYQDISTQVPTAIAHVDDARYDNQFHEVSLVQGSRLAGLYPGTHRAEINSIHHQAIKDLGRELNIEAVAVPDGLIEAVRWRGSSYVFGMQWHPEFMAQRQLHPDQLDGRPILREFLDAARARRRA